MRLDATMLLLKKTRRSIRPPQGFPISLAEVRAAPKFESDARIALMYPESYSRSAGSPLILGAVSPSAVLKGDLPR